MRNQNLIAGALICGRLQLSQAAHSVKTASEKRPKISINGRGA